MTKPRKRNLRFLVSAGLAVGLSVLLLVLLLAQRQNTTPYTHFMEQINHIREAGGMNSIERHASVDVLANFIRYGYEDFFGILEEMEALGLADDGQYPYFWRLHVRSSVAEQINALPVFDQGVFVNPDVIYWGHHIDSDTLDYILVLILGNPLFERTERYLEGNLWSDYDE